MKRSTVLSIGVVLVVALGIMIWFLSGSKGRAVQKVLDQVDANVAPYTIDLRSCPPDFQEAFVAWKAIYVPEHIDPDDRLAFLLNNMTKDDAVRINEKIPLMSALKSKSWEKVETVALRYGAQTGMSSAWGWWTCLKGYVGISTNTPAP